MNSSGLAILEACLVHFGCDDVGASGLDSLEDCFLHDLRQVRPDHDGPDLIQVARTFREGLL